MNAEQFQCSDPFRRMVVTWDGRHTMPCCQGFTLEIDGGRRSPRTRRRPLRSLKEAWASPNFERLRNAHRQRTWDRPGVAGETICQSCAVTKMPDAHRARAQRAARPGRPAHGPGLSLPVPGGPMSDETSLAPHVRAILAGLGEDPDREGLQKTPERVEKALRFLTQGYADRHLRAAERRALHRLATTRW